ncbi:polysaccharide deacetylase family protein [Bizionia paragorgiae]|uniref:polysaccharide deacetylase family protein n=1 Tax=Bizionia paragorgiae TaxID=283786 RepID=UPI00299E44A0|nr:polysaccharide deacetylase family protein [Bizionia paragorgiae]MDX1272618.1 polysaccharide deacetylase family protein [Bizionia paragorgiae]
MAKLPVLMYHSVSEHLEESNGLTIAANKLDEHFQYLASNGYTTLHFKDLQGFTSPDQFPEKAVIITFDDVYVNQLELAYPLLKKYNFKACFYIPFQYVGKVDSWNTGKEPIMTVEQLKSLDQEVIELGLHSFEHKKYDEMSEEEVQEDFDKCKAFISQHKLNIHNTLAYPYGKYPKKGDYNTNFFASLDRNRIAYGLRIGNRVNHYPFANNYEVQRIDIKGEYALKTFIRKLKKGKSWF